jgi:hypothetical protein
MFETLEYQTSLVFGCSLYTYFLIGQNNFKDQGLTLPAYVDVVEKRVRIIWQLLQFLA